MVKEMNSKGQITIFVILGMIIVVAIIMLFVLIKGPEIQAVDEENPQAFIESCTKEYVEEAIDILSIQGGDIIPKGSVMFKNIERTYLCYNSEYYKPCINQRPLLIEHIQDEITDYIGPKVNECFGVLKSKLEPRYDVEIGEMNLEVELKSKQVVVDIDRDFKMTKGENVREFKEFKMNMIHPVYDLSKIASGIVNQEARFCNFDILSFMIFYPEYDMNKFRPGESDIVYQIRERATNQEFWFAVRSCALPPGF